MKKTLILLPVLILILSTIFCGQTAQKKSGTNELTEDGAVQKIANQMFNKSTLLSNKKLSVFNFTNLEGKETAEGKRIANKLLEKLIQKSSFKLVERSEIDKILKEQGMEQTGIVDKDIVKDSGKVLPIDSMITGIVAQINGGGEISVKIVDISTGGDLFRIHGRL